MPARKPSDIHSDLYFDDVMARLPRNLYRYSGIGGERLKWLRELLVDNRMFFPSPRQFNDPLDCRVEPDFKAFSLTVEHHWRRVAREIHDSDDSRQRKRDIRSRVQASRTPAGRAAMAERIFKGFETNGVGCFAKSPTNTLMWAYYSEGHQGVAIRLNMNPATALQHMRYEFLPVEVMYRDAPPKVNFYTESTAKLLATLLGTKAKAWQHEEEWRLVIQNKVGLIGVPPTLIDGVILGLKTPAAVEQEIRGWILLRKAPTELLRIRIKEGSFDLETVRLS
jgi:hypothetical protein